MKLDISLLNFYNSIRSFRSLVLGMSLLGAVGCATRNGIVHRYTETIGSGQTWNSDGETKIIILIDGLSQSRLVRSLRNGDAKNIAKFFVLNGKPPQTAIAGFPSLTYPGLTSILTGLPVSEHQIFGNRVFLDDRVVKLESPRQWPLLQSYLREKSIFSRLRLERRRSVSFSYPFYEGSTAYVYRNFEAGVHYATEDYRLADEKTLESAKRFFSQVPVQEWPDFVFIHLVSVDGIAHNDGDASATSQKSFRVIDEQLDGLFYHFYAAKKLGRTVRVMLTSDHGFVQPQKTFLLDKFLDDIKFHGTLLNDRRVARIVLDKEDVRESLVKQISQRNEIELIGFKRKKGIWIQNSKGSGLIEFDHDSRACSVKTGNHSGRYRYVWRPNGGGSNIDTGFRCTEYFFNTSHIKSGLFSIPMLYEGISGVPDNQLTLVAGVGVSFESITGGEHGGISSDEMVVPLLLHEEPDGFPSRPLGQFEIIDKFVYPNQH